MSKEKDDAKKQEIFNNLCKQTLKDREDLTSLSIKELKAVKMVLQAVQKDFIERYGKGHSLLIRHFADVDVAVLLKLNQSRG